jgi:hypothetical protein
LKRLFDSDDGTTAGGAAVLESGTTQQSASTGSSGSGSATSSSADEWSDVIGKLKGAPADVWDRAIKEAPEAAKPILKTVRKDLIAKEAEGLLPSKLTEIESKYKGDLETLSKELESYRAREREARRATMSDDEIAVEDLKEQLTTAQAKASQLDTLVARMEEMRAVEAIVGYAKEKWTILTDEDLDAIRGAAEGPDPGPKMIDTAMQLASKRLEEKMSGVEDLKTKLESLERRLEGNSTFAATAGGSGGGGEVGDNIQRLWMENPRDPNIREKYYAWRKQTGRSVA